MTPSTKATASGSAQVSTPPAADKKTDSTTTTDTSTDMKIVPSFSAGLLTGSQGGRNGAPIVIDSQSELGDYRQLHLDFALKFELFGAGGKSKNVRFGVGPRLAWNRTSGNENTGYSGYDQLTGGALVDLDWVRSWGPGLGGFLKGPSYINLFAGLGYGWGTGTAETFSLQDQSGLAWDLGASLNLLNGNIGSLQLGLDGIIQTTGIDGSDHNSFGNYMGLLATARPGVNKVEVARPEDRCEATRDNIEQLRGEIHGENGLLAQIAEYEKKVAVKRRLLTERSEDPLDDKGVVEVLRAERARELAQKDGKLSGLDPKKDAEKIKAASAEYASQAERDFPSADAWWNAQGNKVNEGDLVIPKNLDDLNCDELNKLYAKASKGRKDLENRLGQLKKVYDAPFTPRKTTVAPEPPALPGFKGVNFLNAKPTANELKALQRALAAAQAKGGDPLSDPAVRTQLNTIFGPTAVGTVVQSVKDNAEVMNNEARKDESFTIVGHTSKRGDAASNKSLSDRRADTLMAMLNAVGVTGSRLTGVGMGEEQPLDPQEESYPAGGVERATAEGMNRRIEIVSSRGGEAGGFKPPPGPAAKPAGKTGGTGKAGGATGGTGKPAGGAAPAGAAPKAAGKADDNLFGQ